MPYDSEWKSKFPMKQTAVKLITLISFVSLIALFVTHRVGYWQMNEDLLQLSPNGGALPTSNTDTLPDSIVQPPLVIPSSKVIILTPPEKKTVRPKRKKKKAASKPRQPFMGGSKSAPVFIPLSVPDTTLMVPDSTKPESAGVPDSTRNKE